MHPMKKFSSFSEQVYWLIHKKKIEVKDKRYAEEILQQIGYFSLMGYKHLFRIPNTKKYKAGTSFEEIVTEVESYISSMNTFFVIETLETLRKAGRLSGLKAFVANTLNIKPVMGSTKEGTIQQLGQARGMKKALSKMVEDMLKVTKNCENRVLAISHCNCPERAQFVKDTIEKVAKFKKIVIVNTAGVSSMYANEGGVILSV